VGSYTFRFEGVRDIAGPNYRGARGTVEVTRDGRFIEKLHPRSASTPRRKCR